MSRNSHTCIVFTLSVFLLVFGELDLTNYGFGTPDKMQFGKPYKSWRAKQGLTLSP